MDVLDLQEELHKYSEVPYIPLTFRDDEMLCRSQQFYEHMRLRRSVRCFNDKDIPIKVVQNLIKTAGENFLIVITFNVIGTSPSAANLQPWTFCVVHNAKIKTMLRAIIEEEEQANYSRRMGAKWVLHVDHLTVHWNKPYITEAPYVIVVMKHVSDYFLCTQKVIVVIPNKTRRRTSNYLLQRDELQYSHWGFIGGHSSKFIVLF